MIELGGGPCFSSVANLTTGDFGEWKTERQGVGASCNNASQDYFLEILINNESQGDRRRLTIFDFLRKDVDEITTKSFEADIIKVKTGFKDLNKAIWQSKLNYARDFANSTLIEQQKIALKLITTTTGESIESKIIKLQQAGEQAKTLINSEFEIAQAKILEAKSLSLLNGEKPEDTAAIEAEANLHSTTLNLTAQKQITIIEQALNNSIAEVKANDNGKRFAIKDADGSLNLSSGNITTTGTGFFSFLGSLANRITKLFVQDIDASGSVNVSGNITSPQYKSIDAGEIKTGLTSSKFRVCDKFKVSDNTCEEWCKLEITGGIITACK